MVCPGFRKFKSGSGSGSGSKDSIPIPIPIPIAIAIFNIIELRISRAGAAMKSGYCKATLVFKTPLAGKHHGCSGFVTGFDGLIIIGRPACLDHA